jgi:hypothetical protein
MFSAEREQLPTSYFASALTSSVEVHAAQLVKLGHFKANIIIILRCRVGANKLCLYTLRNPLSRARLSYDKACDSQHQHTMNGEHYRAHATE